MPMKSVPLPPVPDGVGTLPPDLAASGPVLPPIERLRIMSPSQWVCVGEPIEATTACVAFTAPLLPQDRPRYLMGMGTPQDILHAIGAGVDLLDCTLPTRNGRNAMAFTREGPLRLRNARFAKDERPLDPQCQCPTCRRYSRAFLRHLFLAREMNAAILTSQCFGAARTPRRTVAPP